MNTDRNGHSWRKDLRHNLQGLFTITTTGRQEDNGPYRWSFCWPWEKSSEFWEGFTTTGTFTDRSDQDGPFRVPFCGTFQVLKIPEITDSILDTHFEVRGITI